MRWVLVIALITFCYVVWSPLWFTLQYVGRLLPPSWSAIPTLASPILETLVMSLIGTSLAFLTAIALAFPAHRGLAGSIYVYTTARAVLAVMRATPVLVLGIICVAALGFGSTAGIVGIWFHTSGVLGKYLSEAFEASDKDVLEASEIDGCTKLQTYFYVMIPMQMNALMSYLLYYYEANFRQATFLGIVGAGGIGLYLTTAVGLFDYGQVGMIVILIIFTSLLLDMTSRVIRSRYL